MSNKKHAVVITTINLPTQAVQQFAQDPECQLIVIGDKKSPQNWHCKNAHYLSIEAQSQMGSALENILPYHSYCRKMLGYLEALRMGFDRVVDTDDDNIPKPDWMFPPMNGDYDTIEGNRGMVNVYQLFTEHNIWPRGLPLSMIRTDFELGQALSRQPSTIGMWQGLADEDPDVDAIYRLTSNADCYFDKRDPVVLAQGSVCPCNTQNTLVRKELYALMYLPVSVTFRFTDILRGLIAQPIMWMADYRLGFLEATVTQKRNEHDLMEDFRSELPMYEHCDAIVGHVQDVIQSGNSVEDNLHCAYVTLLKAGIVSDKEMPFLESWLQDLQRLS